jgi:hypothetical protein
MFPFSLVAFDTLSVMTTGRVGMMAVVRSSWAMSSVFGVWWLTTHSLRRTCSSSPSWRCSSSD